jgi:serine/threonine protein kinase/tetratricopeptide (TPR) repeat protein
MADPKSSQPSDERQHPETTPDDGETLLGEGSSQHKSSAVKSAFSKGQVLAGRFRVLRFVARGGMGEVYEAEDLELNERVALKTVRFEMADNERTVERFKREIQLARKVTHPNVCRTFDVFRHTEQNASDASRETLIVSMELLRGTTLAQRIQLDSRIATERAMPIVEQIAAGLQAAHDAGVIHRDFKSANVILVPAENSPSGTRAVITDFGLAHAAVGDMASLTGSLEVVGTPAYMAPEQLEGKEITPATDTYALGIVMYEMLTGKVPFAGGSVFTTAMRRLNEPAPSPRQLVQDIDPRWETVILRCLERAPELRFSSASEVTTALRGGDVTPAPRVQRLIPWKTVLLVGVSALFALSATVAYVGWERSAETKKRSASAPAAETKTRTSVAILGFQNLSGRTGANLLGEVLTDSLWSQLDVDEIRFIPPSRVDDMRRDLGMKEISEVPGAEQLHRIGQYLQSDVLVTGSYRAQGEKPTDKVEWNVHLVRTSNGEGMGSIQESATQGEINELAARAGRLVRSKLNVTLSTQEEARLDNSLSANPEALERFAQAREKLRDFDLRGAIKLLDSSVAADPGFLKARVALAGAWSDLGYEAKAQEEAKKALELAAKMSAEAKGLVTGRYYETIHDWPKAMEQYSSLWTLYQDNPEYGLLLARSQTSAGKAAQGITTLGQVRKLNLGAQMAAQVDLAEAEAQEQISVFDKELAAATAAADIAKSLNAQPLAARAQIQRCGALLNSGKSSEAKPVCDTAQKLNENSGDPLGTARATNELANAYWRSGDLMKAKALYEQALGTAQTIGDKRDEAGALNNLANIRDTEGDKAGAVREYQESMAVAKERGSMADLALAQQNLAMILYDLGKQAEGAEAFRQAIQLARRIGDRQTEARALNNRCYVLLNAAEIQAARESCEQSLQLRRGMEDSSALALSLGSLGDVQFAEGDLAAAEQNYLEALRIQMQRDQKSDAATSRIWLAKLALENGRIQDAKRFAEDAAQEFAVEKDAGNEGAARATLAEILLASGDVDGARREIETARNLAQSAGDHSLRSQVDLAQAKLDLQTANAEGAIRGADVVAKEARKSGDLLFSIEAQVTLGQAQLKAGRAEGRKTLASAAQEAKAKGLGLLAKKAAAAAAGARPIG